VHQSRTERANKSQTTLNSHCENNETTLGFGNSIYGYKTVFKGRMRNISKNDRVALKYILNIRFCQTVFAAFWPIAIIPIDAVILHIEHLIAFKLCTYNCAQGKILHWLLMKYQIPPMRISSV
jgi:hypothetical protein